VWNPQRTPAALRIVVAGFVLREGFLAGRRVAEILGAGDVAGPVDAVECTLSDASAVRWRGLSDVQVALIPRDLLAAAGRWPALIAELLGRAPARLQRAGAVQTILALPRVEDCLLLRLWDLAERWGRVTPDGVHVELRLSRAALAALTAAHEATISHAVLRLERRGHAYRRSAGWTVTRSGAAAVDELLSIPGVSLERGDRAP
jgi:CRP/FNR family cyclic AMP-dependent transcriptional regulator